MKTDSNPEGETQVMDELQHRRFRRQRAERPEQCPEPRESAETVLPDLPRVGALDALLREVDSLRLSLETDLTLAAAAVESGQVPVAMEIIDSERSGLQAFEQRALGHLGELATPKRRIRVPAAPFVAAAAVAGFLIGVVPHTNAPTSTNATSVSSDSATESLQILKDAASSGDAAQALEAATTLHAQVLAAVAQAQDDPRAASQALLLLSQEQQVLATASHGSVALAQALAVSRQLTTQIKSLLAPLPTTSPAPIEVLAATPRPARPSAQPSSSPKATTSPAARPTHSTTAKPSPTASPSTSPSSGGGPLPGAPGFS
jgi:FlaG/FlaF family flagellin (archaellin)